MNTGQVDDQMHIESDERYELDRVNHDKSNHDILASLAITKGFNRALESSFSELCASIQQLQCSDSSSGTKDLDLKNKVEQLEADCRFCLSRIERSLKQLEVRIDNDSRLNNEITESKSEYKP